ncbi:MAG TPA: PilW family protein [Thermoanaerobaculia bacterium]|nr:PilW family protein [Thermoanaerobaculia bacterium]
MSAARMVREESGFTLVEMIVVVFLLALAMIGILSVFDASARLNKSEQDVADAQGAVRYGIYSMTRAIRMAGSGGLPVTQAILNHSNANLPGIAGGSAISYDNVPAGTTVTSLNGDIPVRPGTDMIEVRGVINSPLIGFDLETGCQPCDPQGGCSPCTAADKAVVASATTNFAHVNDDTTNRPQFSQVDAYTAGVTAANPMLVLVAFNDDVHTGCSQISNGQEQPLYPQPPYNVGVISAPTTLASNGSFGAVNFTSSIAKQFNQELPTDSGADPASLRNIRNAGILDDLVFFIDNTNDLHPALAQGIRRGNAFDVVALADDVEDMQVAYGVDLDGNNAVNIRTGAASFDSNVSSDKDGDEWVPNVAGETPLTAADFRMAAGFCPRLHAVMISLVAKSHDPDLTYKAPSATGFLTMNSPTSSPNPREYPSLSVKSFRRRTQTLKINLRNYAYEGG